MIDALYNYRQGDIHAAEFSDEFNALCIPFEESLTEEQTIIFHKLCDLQSETAAAEMRAAYHYITLKEKNEEKICHSRKIATFTKNA